MEQNVGRLLGEFLWPVLVAVPSILVALVVVGRAFSLRARSGKAAALAGAAGVALGVSTLNYVARRAVIAFQLSMPDPVHWLWSLLGLGLYALVVVLFVSAACTDREVAT